MTTLALAESASKSLAPPFSVTFYALFLVAGTMAHAEYRIGSCSRMPGKLSNAVLGCFGGSTLVRETARFVNTFVGAPIPSSTPAPPSTANFYKINLATSPASLWEGWPAAQARKLLTTSLSGFGPLPRPWNR